MVFTSGEYVQYTYSASANVNFQVKTLEVPGVDQKERVGTPTPWD